MVLKVAPRAVLKVALMAPDDEQGRTGPASTTLPWTHCTRTSKKRWKREPSSQGSQLPHCTGRANLGVRVKAVVAAAKALGLHALLVHQLPLSCSGWIGYWRNMKTLSARMA